jgi:ATP-dependent RNA helicase DDX1
LQVAALLIVVSMSAFEELGVMPSIINSLTEMGWDLYRPVQSECIPLILGGGDVAVAAETGAGKTGAFCIPILQTVYETLHTPSQSATVAAAAAAAFSAPIALSPTDRSRNIAIDGPIAQSRHPVSWEGLRATRGVARGRWYFVARPDDDGLCRVGWAGSQATLNLGTDSRGFGYGGTGKKSHGGKFDDYGGKFTKGDAIVSLLEFRESDGAATMSFLRNSENLGIAFESVPGAKLPGDGILYPAVALKNAQVGVDFAETNALAEALGFEPMSRAGMDDAIRPSCMTIDDDEGEAIDVISRGGGTVDMRHPLALILEPSRELAEQVHNELNKFSASLETTTVRRLLLAGGKISKPDLKQLSIGVDIVSGTLGSVVATVARGLLSLENIRFFVLDEADTFATDNLGDVLKLHNAIPARNQVQTLLFSATLHSPEIRNLSDKIQQFPTWVDLKGKEAVPDTVHHTLVRLDTDADCGLVTSFEESMEIKPFPWPLDHVHDGMNDNKKMIGEDAADIRSELSKRLKLAALKRVIDTNNMHHAMLFARTQLDCDNLERFLLLCSGVTGESHDRARFRGSRDSGPEIEYACAVLHGGRRPEERRSALAAFRNGEVRFLVCTDVAARGIDITGLPFLVNVTLSDKTENYIHRVGRVGRSEYMGLAVSLVSQQKEAVWYHSCNKAVHGTCKNRKLVDAGGCVMWYDESKLLCEIEERLGGPIEELGPDFLRKGGADARVVLYGGMRDDAEMGAATAAHIESLKPAVQKLVRMEHEAQANYFALQTAYPIPYPRQ